MFVVTAAHCIDDFYKHFDQPFTMDNVKLIFGKLGYISIRNSIKKINKMLASATRSALH